ncbi:MAG TPA: chemotaxis protein CheW [Polyangiaceae bacterium]|jgi:purine-binding chemotaxis protein CheW
MPELAKTRDRLARRGGPPEALREFLAFTLAGELYAVDLTRIREIVSPPPITPVPRAAAEVLGVCSVRGQLVSILDLRVRLNLEAQPLSRRARILLTEAESGEIMGLVVDEVRQVLRATEAEIEMAGSVLGGDISDCFLGIGRMSAGSVIFLDLGAIVDR